MTQADVLEMTEQRARERHEAMTGFWETLKRLPAYARLVAAMARDERVPWSSRATLAVGGAYLVSPVDLVPGFIPVAGQLDDLYVVLIAVRQALRMAPATVGAEYLQRYALDTEIVDGDLAAIRTLVRVAAVQSAGWSVRQFERARHSLGATLARARSNG